MHSLTAIEQRFADELSRLYQPDEIKQLAYLLAEDRFGWSKSRYLLNRHTPLDADDAAWLRGALAALAQAKPIQYVLGHAWFRGMKLLVNDTVLIPRPETEELVQLIVNHHQKNVSAPLRIIDIGTGSGCIAIALKKALPHAQVSALDISTDALAVARRNSVNQSVHIDFIHADILAWEPVFQGLQPFDIVVSNPPYITLAEKAEMHNNVLEHEPHLALFVQAGAPLLFYEHIATFAFERLARGGDLYVEINRHYGPAVTHLFRKKGLSAVRLHQDMQGADRMVHARKE